MKTHIFTTTLLGAVGIVTAANQASMDMDSWCITYLSTYLAPVSNQASALPSTKREAEESIATDSRRLPLVPSIPLTFGRNTSTPMTRSILSENNQDASTLDTSLISLQSTDTSRPSPVSAETSDLNVKPTGSLTDELATTSTLIQDLSSTASTNVFPTSSSMTEPAGRSIILQVSISDNERRVRNKRATGGFVGIDNPDVCTFAAIFNLAEGQLFDGGVPIYYSGEEFKDLAGQGIPSGDSITTTFATPDKFLVFRNSGLPNGDAGFCQDSNGQVYITFTERPPGCIPVNLAVYNVEQCQDGRLIGDADLTSTPYDIVTSETVIPEAISSESVTSIEGISSVVETQSIESESEGLLMSTSAMVSSRETDSSAKPSSFTTTIPTSGIAPAQSSIFSQHPTISTLSETTSPRTLDMTSGTISSIDISPIDTTTTADTTTASELEAINTDSTTTEDQQTTDSPTVTEDTTSATPIPTFANLPCNDLDSPYQDPSGVSFDILCNNQPRAYIPLENIQTDSFTACVKFCAEDTRCAGLQYLKNTRLCGMFSNSFDGYEETTEIDVAIRILDDGSQITTNSDTTTAQDPTTIADTTTTALSTTTAADPVPPFVEASCNEVSSPYDDPIGVSFDVLCNYGIYGNDLIDILPGNVFTACVRHCALDDRCAIVHFDRPVSLCVLYSDFEEYFDDIQFDAAIRKSGDENPTTTEDTTTTALFTTTDADSVPA
ncbi:hypothetical protein EDB82DRAFT_528635 [Fusarium venenatum]|uniref:uncharacterized protein n=1 Tax=Fusarium venenatum TaxID=56646 RepID=UPI001D8D2C77|nr:hypothetical protein EDB82DRAFT_528635 [Fusarium venenatum]